MLVKSGSKYFYNSFDFRERVRYDWSHPEEKIESQYGNVSFRKWIDLEKKRIESRGGRCTIWRNEDGLLCLTLNHEIFKGDQSTRFEAVDW